MSETPESTGDASREGQWLTTSTNPRWLVKFGIFFVVCFGLGVWGAYDAFIAYPARGKFDAEWKLKSYLEQAEESRQIFNAAVYEPSEELERLRAIPDDELSDLERARKAWLESLSLVASLQKIERTNERRNLEAKDDAGEPFEETETYFDDPADRLRTLKARHDTMLAPKPLSAFDIPVQYIIMAAGFIAAAWIAVSVSRKLRVSYRYEPSTMTLQLPDGRKVTPDMIEDVDKRLWHKFYVTLHFTDDSRSTKLDLYVHVPLEEWVLEMEPHTPNYEPEEEPEPETETLVDTGDADVDEPGDADGRNA